VRRGQTLAELDQADYRHALEGALAQQNSANAGLAKAEAGTRKQELEEARIALDRAQDEYNRMRALFERKSLAPNDFKKFEAVYLAAQQRYSEAREGARREDKDAAAAVVEQAGAQLREARKRLADTILTAPISGMIARRMIDPGDSVAAGYPAIVVMNLDPAQVHVGVPEEDVGSVRKGQTGRILIPSIPGQSFEGRVTQIGVAADPASRTYTVKIEVPNPRTVLRAGMIAEAHIQTGATVRALTLPGECIVADPQGATLVYVYFPAQKRAYARRVETGSAYGREVEIKSGLNGDEDVIVAGQNRLHEGSVVEIVP
jgi:RND family efflux transporter MFP subunit